MEVNDELIDKLARLSMLRIEGEERETLRADLQKMIGFVDRLRDLDTTGVEPLIFLSEARDCLRPDETGAVLSREEALKNASRHDGRHFLVPQAVQKPGS